MMLMLFTLMLWWYSDFYFFFSVLNKPQGQEYLFCSPLFSSFLLPKAAFEKNMFSFTSYFTLKIQSYIKPIHLNFHVKRCSFLFQISGVFFHVYSTFPIIWIIFFSKSLSRCVKTILKPLFSLSSPDLFILIH